MRFKVSRDVAEAKDTDIQCLVDHVRSSFAVEIADAAQDPSHTLTEMTKGCSADCVCLCGLHETTSQDLMSLTGPLSRSVIGIDSVIVSDGGDMATITFRACEKYGLPSHLHQVMAAADELLEGTADRFHSMVSYVGIARRTSETNWEFIRRAMSPGAQLPYCCGQIMRYPALKGVTAGGGHRPDGCMALPREAGDECT